MEKSSGFLRQMRKTEAVQGVDIAVSFFIWYNFLAETVNRQTGGKNAANGRADGPGVYDGGRKEEQAKGNERASFPGFFLFASLLETVFADPGVHCVFIAAGAVSQCAHRAHRGRAGRKAGRGHSDQADPAVPGG